MKLNVNVWRQRAGEGGRLVRYEVDGLDPDMSFLEMMDTLNEQLEERGEEPVAFDHDCREGICGSCSMVIDGRPHGPRPGTTTCQLYLRSFRDGDTVTVEPWRARSLPVLRDLMVDRSALDRVMSAGGYVSVRTGSAPDANAIPVRPDDARAAFEAASCIGCGACVAACPNASAMLFGAAKVSQLAHLPQGQPERSRRALEMVEAMDAEGFGHCTNHGVCATVCPKEIPLRTIAELNRDLLRAAREELTGTSAD